MHIVFIRKRYYFPQACTSKKVVYRFEVKVDVQKGALRLREILDSKCFSLVQFTFSFTIIIWT